MAAVSARPRAKKKADGATWPNGLTVGFHLSIAAGPETLFERFRVRGCTALQIFTASPRVWEMKPWPGELVDRFHAARAASGSPPLIVHVRYLANLASANPDVRRKSVDVLRFEYEMAARCGADYAVIHMGSNPDHAEGMCHMKDGLRAALGDVATASPLLLLENTAGERNDLGADLADIAEVRDEMPFPTGVCLDTCHVFQAGYDLREPSVRDQLERDAVRLFGRDGVRVIHLNDSMKPFGAHHDRHENIGSGVIGAENLAELLLRPGFAGRPVIMETPQAGNEDPADDLKNLARLRAAFASLAA
ncbi:MAG TPA: deoxyribonuclease IV [Candidatus Ozemobacteraceae bacterium]|nr:deoxyribonuclease IV [Candidatus Ozemobacteraceae bacterium]